MEAPSTDNTPRRYNGTIYTVVTFSHKDYMYVDRCITKRYKVSLLPSLINIQTK